MKQRYKNEFSETLNGIKYQMARNTDIKYLRENFRIYATMNFPKCFAVDLYNKTYQLNDNGFLKYIETILPKKHFVEVIKQY